MTTEEVPVYIAITIAESRIKKAREKLNAKLKQEAQLAGGRLIQDDEGVVSEVVRCPSCGDGNLGGYIEVPAPFGLEVGEMALPATVRIDRLNDGAIIWGVRSGVLKLSVDTKSFDSHAKDTNPEVAHMMAIIGPSLLPNSTPTLRVISPEKLKEDR